MSPFDNSALSHTLGDFSSALVPPTPTLISSELKLVDGVKMWFLVSAFTSAIYVLGQKDY